MQAQERRKSMGRCLLEAAKNGQLETMKYLLNEGAPVNFQDQVFQQHKKCSNSFGKREGETFAWDWEKQYIITTAIAKRSQ